MCKEITVQIKTTDELGFSNYSCLHISTLEEKLGDKLPKSLSKEARKKLEYIYLNDPVEDLIKSINNNPHLHGLIKATRI